jgi:myo-inositol-1-phosphate synthase
MTHEGRTGVWLVGARGSVAATTIVGGLALADGLTDGYGCVTARQGFPAAGLPGWTDLVFGGHDTGSVPLHDTAARLASAGVIPGEIASKVAERLTAVEWNIRGGYQTADDRPQQDAITALAEDLREFRHRNELARIVVVNVSSTEGGCPPNPAHRDPALLAEALRRDTAALPASSVYAFAALQAGCGFVDFTPSTGIRLAALRMIAQDMSLPYAGNDGKTGETLIKSVLAPMFAQRNLAVRSWSGINLLGGGDGANLASAGPLAAKSASKQRVLAETLGYTPEGTTTISYVPDIGDFKSAWDLVTFTGFLGTRMRMDFTWHGCDSALAAPLVLDLARLVARAHEVGISGALGALAFFFKDPLSATAHDLAGQYRDLVAFAERLAASA